MSSKKGSASRRKSTSSVSPMPQLSDDIILKIMDMTIDGSHTGLARVSGINSKLTSALKKKVGSLRHSPSGNIDEFVRSYGPEITVGSLVYAGMDEKHAFFLNQLAPMVHGMISEEVWKFNRKYTYDRDTNKITKEIPAENSPDLINWEKLWVYAKLLSYINSNGTLLKQEVRYITSHFRYINSRDLDAELSEKILNASELKFVLYLDVKTTNMSDITNMLTDVSYDCKKMFPIWSHDVLFKDI